jgi:hypothetical protein
MNKKIILASAAAAIIIASILVASLLSARSRTINNSDNDQALNNTKMVKVGSNIHFMIPILNKENPDQDVEALRKYLRSGDIVVFPPNAYKQISELKKQVAGLEIGTGGISVTSLLPGIQRIPLDVNYVTYDYERDFTPEWTTNQTKSSDYFKQLYDESHKYDKKLAAVPVFVFGKDWDWGEVAKDTDVLVVQVQNFQTNAQVPEAIKPSSLNMDLIQVTKLLVQQVKAKSPTTQVYLQLGFEVTDNADNILQDIEKVKDLGIDGIALWYNPGTSGQTSKLHLLEETMQRLDRE